MKDGNADDPRQDRAVRLIALWSALHDAIVGAVEDELGRHGLRDVLYQRLFETARDAAVQSQPDATAIADEIMQLEQDFGLCGNVLERAPERVVREVTKCPWSNVRPASCRVFAWWMEGYCQGRNPLYRYHLEQLMTEGAETCVWSVSKQAQRQPRPSPAA